MEKSTHSERVAVAIAMRKACVDACLAQAPAKEAQSYRAADDKWRIAAAEISRVDPVALVSANDPPASLTVQEAFEQVAREKFFNCQKKDDGSYLHPITGRAWALWQAAIKFKEDLGE